jgi:hypothetical protein
MVNDDDGQTSEPRAHHLRVIARLRDMGAVRVRVADVEVEWQGPPPEPDGPPRAAQAQTQDQLDRILFHSSG